MENNEKTNNSVLAEVKEDFNTRSKTLAKKTIDSLFDYLEECISETIKDKSRREAFVETVKSLLKKPEAEDRVVKLWSDSLVERGLIHEGYGRLSDVALIHNLHQNGYNEGRLIGHYMTLIPLMKSDAPKEQLKALSDFFSVNFGGKMYEDRKELYEQFDEERRKWKERNT